MSQEGSGSRRRSDATRSIQQILAAASELDDAAWSMEDVAAAADVGVATVYRHFSTRDRLVQAVAARAVASELEPHVAQALSSSSPREALRVLCTYLIRLSSERAHSTKHPASMIAAILTESVARYVSDLETLLTRAQDAGEIRGDLDRNDIAPIMGFMLAGLTLPFSADYTQDRYIALVFEALRPDGATPLPPHRRE